MIRARTWSDRNETPLKFGRALRQGAENSLSPITAPPRAVVFFQTPPEPANLPAVERGRRHSSAAIDRPRRRHRRHPVAARLLRRTAPPAVAAALIPAPSSACAKPCSPPAPAAPTTPRAPKPSAASNRPKRCPRSASPPARWRRPKRVDRSAFGESPHPPSHCRGSRCPHAKPPGCRVKMA